MNVMFRTIGWSIEDYPSVLGSNGSMFADWREEIGSISFGLTEKLMTRSVLSFDKACLIR